MSDLRAPGNPGGTKGKSESQKIAAPIAATNHDGAAKSGGHCVAPVTPGRTSGNKNRIR